MKELMIQIRINDDQTATVIKKQGFDENISSSYEVIGILQNIIRIEQDKMMEKSTTITKNGQGKI